MSKIPGYFSQNPEKLFLLDSIGAFLTALLLVLMLLFFNKFIGIDTKTLCLLISIAVLYSIYSFLCFKIQPEKWQIFLKIIAAANIIYAGGMLTFLILNHDYLTMLGIVYFSVESVIIISLACLEFKVIKNSGQL